MFGAGFGNAASGTPINAILAYSPHNVWDSEHITQGGGVFELSDYNIVGTKINLKADTALSIPEISNWAAKSGVPSVIFNGTGNMVYNTGIEAAEFRESDSTGVYVSVFKRLDTGTNRNLFLLTSTNGDITNKSINQTINASSSAFEQQFKDASAGRDNVSFGSSTVVENDANVFAVSFNGDGVYKFNVNGSNDTPITVTAESRWFNSVLDKNNVAIGGLIGSSNLYANIEWCFTGYFPYVSDDTTLEIISVLKSKYGV